MIEKYPSLELAYRAGDRETVDLPDRAFESSGPPLAVVLGDRSTATLSYTVRFRLDLDELRSVHERFGGQGIWAAVRDQSAASLRRRLCEDGVGIDDLYGPARRALEAELTERLEAELGHEGLTLVLFTLGDTDLGRTGEVIQATARARYELAREEAEAETRRARARNDVELGVVVGDASMEAALRYREVDAWREVAWTTVARGGPLPQPSVRASTPQLEPTAEPIEIDLSETTEP
jgi:SPFH domain/Band 7 family protein